MPLEKDIDRMLHVYSGDISDKNKLDTCLKELRIGKNLKIDTIVNAAKPTLMGSKQGVDGAIHKVLDQELGGEGKFNAKIREELDDLSGIESEEDIIVDKIRCPRGKAVITKGYGLCKYIIHVVGSQYDGIEADPDESFKKQRKVFKTCSSSRIRMLESCYREIINIVKARPYIKNIAIPIVGSGEYKFPYELALRIAIAGIGNALIDWKQKDPESFSDMNEGLQNIVFFIFPDVPKKENMARRTLEEYKSKFKTGKQVVTLTSTQSQLQYINEIKKYDVQRGYFFIARSLRKLLSYFRLVFIWSYLKDWIGKNDWQKRRCVIEIVALVKMLFPVISWLLVRRCTMFQEELAKGLGVILAYNLLDTVTYLIMLIIMADIQKPSANIIRSIILLAFNYLEMAFSIAYFYYLQYSSQGLIYREALKIGIVGGEGDVGISSWFEYILFYANTALKFFFVTLVFGYLAGHMRQRKFRT